MKYLLDVNILLAGIWGTHPLNSQATAWLKDKEIVLCPIVELGFIRISAHKQGYALPMVDIRKGLEKFAAERDAERIADDLPALESRPATSDQVTDHYLADLAVKHGFKLATLDRGLKHPAVELVT